MKTIKVLHGWVQASLLFVSDLRLLFWPSALEIGILLNSRSFKDNYTSRLEKLPLVEADATEHIPPILVSVTITISSYSSFCSAKTLAI